MDQIKFKSLSYLIGGLAMLVAGLFYILVTDLKLLNTAEWLFIAIFTAFGSGFCAILSESIKHKHLLFYILKYIGFVCSIAFIIIIFSYTASIDILNIVKVKGVKTADVQSTVNFVKIFCLFFAFIGSIFQAGNIALNTMYGIDD